MAVISCNVIAGGGGWNSIGTYPANQNDGDNGTYQWWPGDTVGSNDNYYDSTQIPTSAVISSVFVSGLWGAGSAPATTNFTCHLGGNTTNLGTIGDVTSYSGEIARPGGGTWTKADILAMFIRWTSLATGNGNAMKLRSSTLTVYYTLPATNLAGVLVYM